MSIARVLITFAILSGGGISALASDEAPAPVAAPAPSAEVAKPRTYSWLPGTPSRSPAFEASLHEAVDAQLAAKGLRHVESGGDLVFITHVGDTEARFSEPYGHGPGMRTFEVNYGSVPAEKIFVDALNLQSQEVVWHSEGLVTLTTKDETNATRVNKVVKQMFRKFALAR